jgi:hypothetical protein
VSMEGRLELGNLESRKRNLRRQKRKVLPPEPAELKDLRVEGEWATTGGPSDTSTRRPFLIHDSGTDRPDRILVFSSPEQLRQLALAQTWFMDGTFSTAPKIFTQVYVIRVPLDDSAVTCAYAFMTGMSIYKFFIFYLILSGLLYRFNVHTIINNNVIALGLRCHTTTIYACIPYFIHCAVPHACERRAN